mmetsp:Transcript_21710/g.29112  ORF Transcript_21710/g.29112 Transcript_21710/m.29112 type:complete len:127 (+) Transcript_21710:1143-1523(+)
MTFTFGYSDTKHAPEANWRVSERKLDIKYKFEQTNSPRFDALIVSAMLFAFIAIVPSLFSYIYLVHNKESGTDEVIGWSIIGVSVAFSAWLSLAIFYPFFRSYFDKENEEWPVLKPEDALKVYFAV